MSRKKRIAIIGGGEKELSILSQFHNLPGYSILGIYDWNKKALALGIAEILGIDTISDNSFLNIFRTADYIFADRSDVKFKDEIDILSSENLNIIDLSETYMILNNKEIPESSNVISSIDKFEEALRYLDRISNRKNLLEWVLEIAVEQLGASSGSIMLSPRVRRSSILVMLPV
ncbi:hypothetical protein J7M07_04360 [bacterium]|nr:hypothetical protein [bacterium]